MNLQAMTIIFAIIFLPIILISTYYIQLEVDTIRLQSSYDTKLIDATTDAVSAFEINTANQDLSSVSDSLRSIIDASNNVFINTLATNLGMSSATKSKIIPYIPAVVYTLYDGYYIYAPTQSPKVVTDPNGVYVKVGDDGTRGGSDTYYYDYGDVKNEKASASTINPDFDTNYGKILYYFEDPQKADKNGSITCTTDPSKAYYTTNYMLKSFTPYSMSYVKGNGNNNGDYNITINYTLDNFIAIAGTVKKDGIEVYYTKSGYLVDINSIAIDGIDYNSIAQDKVDEIVDEKLSNKEEVTVSIYDLDIKLSDAWVNDAGEILSAKSEDYTGSITYDNVSAIKYYIKAYIFSRWVEDNFGNLQESNANELNSTYGNGFTVKQKNDQINNNSQLFYEYTNKTVFKSNGNWNVENKESNFYEHKRNVIKNSIQYNLNLAMALYNAGKGDEYYQMPVISDLEWDKILSNVSVLSFMQGLPCGMRTYSNYSIVTSRNNELLANEDDIFYVPIYDPNDKVQYYNKFADGTVDYYGNDKLKTSDQENDGVRTSEYSESSKELALVKSSHNRSVRELNTAHKLICDHLSLSKTYSNSGSTAYDVKYFQSFPSREVKYDKVWDADKRQYVYDHLVNSCYYCIINSNYDDEDDEENEIKRALLKLYPINEKSEYEVSQVIEKEKSLLIDKYNTYSSEIKTLKTAELIAMAKIRNNTYKSVEYTNNYGISFDNNNPSLNRAKLAKSYEVEITIEDAKQSYDNSGYSVSITADSVSLGGESKTYSVEHDLPQLLYFSNPDVWNITDPNLKLVTKTGAELKIVSIMYKYK